jgi:hypothetical protein
MRRVLIGVAVLTLIWIAKPWLLILLRLWLFVLDHAAP